MPAMATSRPPSLAARPTPHEAPACTTLASQPLLVPTATLYQDPGNPRSEFTEPALAELFADVQVRGILQPLVVRPADFESRHRIQFGAKRLRAAIRVGLLPRRSPSPGRCLALARPTDGRREPGLGSPMNDLSRRGLG